MKPDKRFSLFLGSSEIIPDCIWPKICVIFMFRFKMIKHGGDPGNTINVHRYRRLRQSRRRIRVDGLSTLDTEISDVVMYITHLRLKIKTYKTGLQRDLARKKPTTTLSKQNLSSYLPFLQNSTGIAIQLPGTVIINQRKKKRN